MLATHARTNIVSKIQTIVGYLAVFAKASSNNVLYVTSHFKVVSQNQTE